MTTCLSAQLLFMGTVSLLRWPGWMNQVTEWARRWPQSRVMVRHSALQAPGAPHTIRGTSRSKSRYASDGNSWSVFGAGQKPYTYFRQLIVFGIVALDASKIVTEDSGGPFAGGLMVRVTVCSSTDFTVRISTFGCPNWSLFAWKPLSDHMGALHNIAHFGGSGGPSAPAGMGWGAHPPSGTVRSARCSPAAHAALLSRQVPVTNGGK